MTEHERPDEDAVRERMREQSAPAGDPSGEPADPGDPDEETVREELEEHPAPEQREHAAPADRADAAADGRTAPGEQATPDAEAAGRTAPGDQATPDAEAAGRTGPAQAAPPGDSESGSGGFDSPAAAPVDEDPLTVARRERDEYLALAQRAQADFENYRRRAARDAAAAGARAKGGLVRELLPVVDNLERALAAAGEHEAGLAQGVRLVLSELVGVLERSGVRSFEPHGERFDPTVHDALSTRPADGTEPGVVVDVVEKGYRLDESVIRPARVVVSA